jgi:non-specific serine/threonine protein kinase
LEPVSRASESCFWLKSIVDSGQIFHPLRCTPPEAMRLLEDVRRLSRRVSNKQVSANRSFDRPTPDGPVN